MTRYAYTTFPYVKPPELSGGGAARRPVVIVGAGPVGLALAIDLAMHAIPVVVLDDNDRVSVGSRAICWSKRTLEIFDRLGVGARMVEKGVTWKVGRLFHRDAEVYAFDLLPEPGHRMPAFVNLQQYYVEEYLAERAADFPDLIELRWKNRVAGVAQGPDGVTLTVETSDGAYALESDWVVACDGVRSTVRTALGLDFAGEAFEERFLIADVEMKAPFPSERWFWFASRPSTPASRRFCTSSPTTSGASTCSSAPTPTRRRNAGRRRSSRASAPWSASGRSSSTGCRSIPSSAGVSSASCTARVIFAGDSAHIVSPFGARGGNGGIQDADNLAWKLARVIRGEAGRGADRHL